MPKQKYIRKGSRIISFANGGSCQDFPSISLAKKESRRIQMEEDGALGRGVLVVEK